MTLLKGALERTNLAPSVLCDSLKYEPSYPAFPDRTGDATKDEENVLEWALLSAQTIQVMRLQDLGVQRCLDTLRSNGVIL